jgi:hypothetical protein
VFKQSTSCVLSCRPLLVNHNRPLKSVALHFSSVTGYLLFNQVPLLCIDGLKLVIHIFPWNFNVILQMYCLIMKQRLFLLSSTEDPQVQSRAIVRYLASKHGLSGCSSIIFDDCVCFNYYQQSQFF